MKKKTCFVLIGFGVKTDYPTGRKLDLDATYDALIKPVFDGLKINCFRAKDIIHSGVIDIPMYDMIYKADIVVADLSTLNPNVLYELGVRHTLKPHTTIVISEDKLDKIPFDLSHLNVDPVYHHLGEDIGVRESSRFKKVLKEKVKKILINPKNDSPVYAYLKSLKIPEFTKKEIDKLKLKERGTDSLSKILQQAEESRKNSEFITSIKLLKKALKLKKGTDTFIIQKLALCTYKNKKPKEITSLKNALKILQKLNPDRSTDPETLGLCGAIYKRLYEKQKAKNYLEKSIWFYERGFYIRQDYYNAINVAFLYVLKSTIQKQREEALTDYNLANRIRVKTISLCDKLIRDKSFKERVDKNWIFYTLAEAYLGLGNNDKAAKFEKLGNKNSEGKFDKETYHRQKDQLMNLIKNYQKKWQ